MEFALSYMFYLKSKVIGSQFRKRLNVGDVMWRNRPISVTPMY